MSDTYLVTGGAGFIGSGLVRALLERGARVRVLDNFSTGKEENLEGLTSRIDVIRGDLRDVSDVRAAVQGVDYVLHQAALASVPRSMIDPIASNDVNAGGTLHVFHEAAAAGVKRVVYASSSSVYGETEVLPKVESMPLTPISPYAASKATAELYGAVYTRAFGLGTVGLRYFNVFGPRQDPDSEYAAVIPKFIMRMMAGESPIIFGDGTQSRDFCFLDNVVEANLAACRAPSAPGRVLNVACGERITLLQLVDYLNEALGTDFRAVLADERAGDVKHSLADISVAREVLDYTVRVDVRQGIERTVAWYRGSANQDSSL